MAWVTSIVSLDQVDYRLQKGAGCWGSEPGQNAHSGHGHPALQNGGPDGEGTATPDALAAAAPEEHDPALAYRMAAERPMKWFGGGLADHGLTAGTELVTAEDLDAARALMSGASPDGTVRVRPKLALDPKSKLPAAPMIEAMRIARTSGIPAAAGLEGPALTAFVARNAAALDASVLDDLGSAHARRLYRQAADLSGRRGDLYLLPAHELQRLGQAAGVDAVAVYGDDLARAYETGYERRRVRRDRATTALVPKRVTIGARGFDFTITFTKTNALMLAFAPREVADDYEAMLSDAMAEGLGRLEKWAAYGQRGHHGGRDAEGNPIVAQRVETSGFAGWITIHRAARPVDGAPVGDPHWHAHAVIAHMVRGNDGEWSTLGSGGRDIYRHARAVDALIQARVRWEAGVRYGIEFARTSTGVWDISAIPEATIRLFSKRDAQVRELFARLQLNYDQASLKARKAASATTREAKTALGSGVGDDMLREYWQAEARAAGDDPDQIITEVLAGRAVPRVPTVEEIAAIVFDPETGLTSHDKRFGWADAYAAVMDTLPGGIGNADAGDELVAAVLAHGGAVGLPARVPAHMTHTECYTSADVVVAEQKILFAARAGYAAGWAVVDQTTADASLAAYENEHGFTLSAEQRTVYYRAVRGGHGVDAVIGVAGAGKTTIMDVVRRACGAAGFVVEGASTAAVAVDNLRRTAGLGTARTIASYIQALERDRQPLAGVDVLILDEAMMTDDRDMARLLEHAAQTGTKVLGIGDPRQLRSPGIGGGFAAVHAVVGGATLAENRRQTDDVERAAISKIRDREFAKGLTDLAEHGRVHVGRTRDDARAAVLVLWSKARTEWPDLHDQISHVLVMAATNADVNALNAAGRELRRERGELTGPDRVYRVAGAEDLAVAVGDIVLVRINDYRDNDQHDVYNGTRAVVDELRANGDMIVSWREQNADGSTHLITETLTAEFVRRGGVSHGLAITGHKSQGLTCSVGIVYGDGMRGNATYEATTRGRTANHLVYSQEAYEDAETRVRLGDPHTAAALTARTITAVSAELTEDLDESLVSVELRLEDIEVPGTRRRPRAHDADADEELRAILESVPALAHLVDVILDDPAVDKLAARLAAAKLRGQDPAALLQAVLDPELPLENAQRPAAALAWRLGRTDRSPAAEPSTTARTPTAPRDRLDAWAAHTAAELDLDEPTDLRDLTDYDLADTLLTARAAAGDDLDAYHALDATLAELRDQVAAGHGPAERRVRGRLESLRGRGQALEEMAQLHRAAAPLRAELDTLRAASTDPAAAARMAALRARLDDIVARYIALDNLAGAVPARDRVLLAWRRAQAELPQALAQAQERDQRRLAAAEIQTRKLQAASRATAARYAQVVSAAQHRGLEALPLATPRRPTPTRRPPAPPRPPTRRPRGR